MDTKEHLKSNSVSQDEKEASESSRLRRSFHGDINRSTVDTILRGRWSDDGVGQMPESLCQ